MRVIRRLGCWGAMRVHPLPLGGQQPARNWLLHRRVSSRSGRKPMSRRVATDVPNVVTPSAVRRSSRPRQARPVFRPRALPGFAWLAASNREAESRVSISPQISRAWQARCPPKIWEDMSALRVKQITALALDGQKRPCKVRSSNAGSLMKPSFFAQRKQRVDSPCLSRRHKQAAAGWH